MTAARVEQDQLCLATVRMIEIATRPVILDPCHSTIGLRNIPKIIPPAEHILAVSGGYFTCQTQQRYVIVSFNNRMSVSPPGGLIRHPIRRIGHHGIHARQPRQHVTAVPKIQPRIADVLCPHRVPYIHYGWLPACIAGSECGVVPVPQR